MRFWSLGLFSTVWGLFEEDHLFNATELIPSQTFIDFDLTARADEPAVTTLAANGASASIEAGQSHTYFVPADIRRQQVSLSVCSVTSDWSPLEMHFGDTVVSAVRGNTGGRTIFGNGTLVIQPPANSTNGTWTYELGAMDSRSYVGTATDTYLVDTDFANSLLVSTSLVNLTRDVFAAWRLANATDLLQLYENQTLTVNNLTMFIHAANTNGPDLSNSYCAMSQSALLNQNNCDLSETRRSIDNPALIPESDPDVNNLRAQWFVKALNKSSEYVAYMGLPPLPGYSGGFIFDSVSFTTKSSESCQVVYNMSFCDSLAFAVPGNASSFTPGALSALYDKMAEDLYANFTRSIAQINCDADQVDRFSPFFTCEDCEDAYKSWLCTTTIPRCADLNDNSTWLALREVGQSRNPMIDSVIRPGAYKEILPCAELCYGMVRKCPVSLGFGCPSDPLLRQSYGFFSNNGTITCSYPGALYNQSRGTWLQPNFLLFASAFFLCLLTL